MNGTTIRRSVEEIVAPALEQYSRDMAAHDHDYGAWPVVRCRCGWAPSRPMRTPRRAVGLHIAHAYRRANNAYTVAAAALLAEAQCTPSR